MASDCEANYLRLCRLLPELVGLAATAKYTSGNNGRMTFIAAEKKLEIELPTPKPAMLVLKIVEQSRFTSLVELQILNGGLYLVNDEQAGSVMIEQSMNYNHFLNLMVTNRNLSMLVRLYHDARMAEVVAYSGEKAGLASYEYPNEMMFQPDEKAQQNRFLAEWLSISLKHGMARLSDVFELQKQLNFNEQNIERE